MNVYTTCLQWNSSANWPTLSCSVENMWQAGHEKVRNMWILFIFVRTVYKGGQGSGDALQFCITISHSCNFNLKNQNISSLLKLMNRLTNFAWRFECLNVKKFYKISHWRQSSCGNLPYFWLFFELKTDNHYLREISSWDAP